ncbi:glycoside hydrolase family 15 protein [Bdellovibrionota bacterium FG-2]
MAFLPLSEYAAIGNHASTALISSRGSIDWLCLPHLDSPSHFGALLDENKGGRFQICPEGEFHSQQRYLPQTQVLETHFKTATGEAILLDWMPWELSSLAKRDDPVLNRRIEMITGKITWSLHCVPRFNYGSHPGISEPLSDGFLFRGATPDELGRLRTQLSLRDATSATFSLENKQSTQFQWVWGRSFRRAPHSFPGPTIDAWRTIAHRCQLPSCFFAGPWHEWVARSTLVLRTLFSPHTGTIAGAATTSQHDDRNVQIRDSGLTYQALNALGLFDEAQALGHWLHCLLLRDGAEDLQPVYSLDGGRKLTEHELPDLMGYQGVRPVRVGNQSARRFQLDIYGHLMLGLYEHLKSRPLLTEKTAQRLAELADTVCEIWKRPDHGPHEAVGRAEHFVTSKIMCWVALDRVISLYKNTSRFPSRRWIEEREIIHRTVCEQGYNPKRRSFIRSFGSSELDSSVLLIPLVGFLSIEDPRVSETVDAIQNTLSQGVLIHRIEAAELSSGNGTLHIPSSLMLAACIALQGKPGEARDRLAELCSFATPLGLFGETLHPSTGKIGGNFPCAASHIALINAALYLGVATGKSLTHLKPMAAPKTLPKAA